MLINRTIDKPKEKFLKLVEFIERNDLWSAIFLVKSKEYFSLNCVYLTRKKVCEILSISDRTLRNWIARALYQYANMEFFELETDLVRPEYLSDRIPKNDVVGRDLINPIELRHLYGFLAGEVWMSESSGKSYIYSEYI